MKVLKFGGSSVSSPQRIKDVIEIIIRSKEKNTRLSGSKVPTHDIAVVFSAFGGTTDRLIELGALASSGNEGYKELLKELEKRHLDAVKELINVNHQSTVLANVKMMINEL